MKAFIAALGLLATLTGLAFFTSCIFSQKADALICEALALNNMMPTEREAAVQKVADAWESDQFIFALTINHTELDDIEAYLSRLNAAAKNQNGDEYFIAVSELTTAFTHIKELCAVSWDNIL